MFLVIVRISTIYFFLACMVKINVMPPFGSVISNSKKENSTGPYYFLIKLIYYVMASSGHLVSISDFINYHFNLFSK
jgi:hypothetical protein